MQPGASPPDSKTAEAIEGGAGNRRIAAPGRRITNRILDLGLDGVISAVIPVDLTARPAARRS